MAAQAQIYATIDNGTVVNIVVATEITAALFPGSVRIDNLVPVPGIGWSYLGGVFAPPSR